MTNHRIVFSENHITLSLFPKGTHGKILNVGIWKCSKNLYHLMGYTPRSMLLVSGGSPLSDCMPYDFDGIKGGHGGLESEKDDGCAAESDYIYGQASQSGAHKVA